MVTPQEMIDDTVDGDFLFDADKAMCDETTVWRMSISIDNILNKTGFCKEE